MAGYIPLPDIVPVDPDDAYQDSVDRIADTVDGWVPREGHLEVALLQEFARMLTEVLGGPLSLVPQAIFRYFATALVGLETLEGAAATVTSEWTAVDTQGYTIPEGAVVAFQTAGDQLVEFEVVEAVTIDPGSGTAMVELVAMETGAAYNDLGPGEMVQIDLLSWVDTVTATEASSGGIDAETDDETIARLSEEMTLLAPRPILPADFAVLARRFAYRATAIDGYDPGVNEVQQVTVTAATGGTFTLTFSAQTTAAIDHDAAAADVQTALEALSNIDPGDVSATGGPLSTAAVLVEFTGALASTNVAEMTVDDALLTGAGSEAAAVTTTAAGVAASTDNERTIAISAVDEDGATVSEAVQEQILEYLDSLREVNFQIFWADPVRTTISVVFQIIVDSTADAPAVLELAEANVEAFISPANWAGGDESPPAWRDDLILRFNDVMGVLYRTEGVAHVSSLTLNGLSNTDVTLAGPAALPDPDSTVTGTVV